MAHPVFDKTEKGREEIATRKHQLPSRLRTLLLLIDGKHSTEEVLSKVGGLGLTEGSLTELFNSGFIHASAKPTDITHVPLAAPAPATAMPSGKTQFESIYHFYTETIKSTIGLRGYPLQLKVERAASIEDFRALRQPYLEAVLKAKGAEMAKSLKLRLEEVLYAGEEIPPIFLPGL